MNNQIILFSLAATLAIIIAWLIVITLLIINQKRFFAQFTSDVTKKDLKSLLYSIAKSFKEVGAEIVKLNQDVKEIKQDNLKHYQKLGFIRYNPFADTGGDQSFCLCLLDKNNNGIVITSLHSREQTRIYAKTVSRGQAAGYEFAKEELEAVELAIKKSAVIK